jgi:hypothetical protein
LLITRKPAMAKRLNVLFLMADQLAAAFLPA